MATKRKQLADDSGEEIAPPVKRQDAGADVDGEGGVASMVLSMPTIVSEFLESGCRLREVMKKMIDKKNLSESELEELRVQGVMNCAVMKHCNHVGQLSVKETRDAVQEAKRQVDAQQLELQNLLYQVLHLKQEAAQCLEFKAGDEEVNLVSKEEFLRHATYDKETDDGDDHKLMLARLDWELQERQRLVTERLQLSEKKKMTSENIRRLHECLNSLRPGLDNLMKATTPMQDAFSSTFSRQRQLLDNSKHLPEALYLLFVQIQAYAEACDPTLQVTIEGDVEAGRKVTAQLMEEQLQKILKSDSDSDRETLEEEGHHRHHRKKRRHTLAGMDLSKRQELVLQGHPLFIVLRVTEKGCGSLKLTFRYMHLLHCVCVQSEVAWECAPGSLANSFSSAVSILCNLFNRDDGLEAPNTTTATVLCRLGMTDFVMHTGTIGYAYSWAQCLAGMASTTNQKPVASASLFEEVILALRQRLQSRSSLLKQLQSLELCELPAFAKNCPLFPSRLSTRLSSFRVVKDPSVLSWLSSAREKGVFCSSDTCYLATLDRSRAQLQAAIFIGPEYPQQPPVFVLNLSAASDGAMMCTRPNALRAIEVEVNVYYDELIGNTNAADLLALQIKRLQMCFDVFVDTEVSKAGDYLPTDKRFLFCQGGRDFTRPFKYDHRQGVFTFR